MKIWMLFFFTFPCPEETMDMILDSWHRFLRHGHWTLTHSSLCEFEGLGGINKDQ